MAIAAAAVAIVLLGLLAAALALDSSGRLDLTELTHGAGSAAAIEEAVQTGSALRATAEATEAGAAAADAGKSAGQNAAETEMDSEAENSTSAAVGSETESEGAIAAGSESESEGATEDETDYCENLPEHRILFVGDSRVLGMRDALRSAVEDALIEAEDPGTQADENAETDNGIETYNSIETDSSVKTGSNAETDADAGSDAEVSDDDAVASDESEDEAEVLPPDTIGDGEDCLFIGKVGEGLRWFLESGLPRMAAVIEQEPSIPVVIALGVNDLDEREHYLETYASLLGQFPDTDFYFMSVNPVEPELLSETAVLFVKTEEIEAFNEALAAAFPQQFLDCASFLAEDGFTTVDGIHYDYDTYCKVHAFTVRTLADR